MSINPILPQYVDRGILLFPCEANGKRPLLPNGFHGASGDLDQIVAWATRWPGCNWAMPTAGWLVIDVDGADNPWPNDADRALELAAGPMAKTPRGGRHYFFADPDCRYRCATGKLGPNVDHRAAGGYILLYPSTTADGAYQWIESIVDATAGAPPSWLIEALAATSPVNLTSFRVDDSGPALRIHTGQRNATLTSLAGTMRDRGMGEAAILAALREDNRERCSPPLPENEIETIAWSVARYTPGEAAIAIASALHDPSERSTMNEPKDPGPFPQSLLAVPGFLGEVAEYSVKTAFAPQPELALAAALPLLGTLTGRKIADPFGTRTNIYTIGVCESGGGKEAARKVNKEILFQADLRNMLGGEGFASHSGIVNAVQQQPAILFQWDEIGRLLKAACSPQAGAHLYHVPTVMMKFFTSSDSLFIGDTYADTKKNIEIYQPHACLYGTTVPQSFLEGLSAESVTNGFLSRMFVFESSNSDPEPQDHVSAAVPSELIAVARWWGDFKPGGNFADRNPQPYVVAYTDEAKAIMADLRKLSRLEKQLATGPYRTLWTRTNELANKLALLWACSANHLHPVVGVEAARWASDLAQYMTRRLAYLASRWISENRQESDTKRVQRIIEDTGPEGTSKRDLIRQTQWLNRRERDEVLATLVEAGSIFMELIETKTRPRTVYRSARFAALELVK